ncbi:hypothetical protein PV396_24660 [Streptomyces sp. ME02-8801-2C]|uniref:hypothetical protein n=1 Tax=Streptomyces sp. ME02-8801-2C TaxID=3028680 RepID=UPI0029BE9E6B|nr:hypothetical protein [Streptomyces sp. ME02-8801-2C]MDX3455095.1 hypothetical protein [Streptomyces sp. ME02-8801-2C]
MDLITTTYFGWNPLAHAPGCTIPVWDDADIRHTDAIRTTPGDTRPHECAHPDCTHDTGFDRVQLRLLCRTCHTVITLSAEHLNQAMAHTSVTGWGQPPQQLAGVWLWPGRAPAPGHTPYEYLITRDNTHIPTPDTVYGIITGYRDADHVQRWIAAAVPDPDGAHQVSTLRWRHSSKGLATLGEAAAWITDAETRPQRSLVVSV